MTDLRVFVWFGILWIFWLLAREAIDLYRDGCCLRCGGRGGHRSDCPNR